ncbi:hypothetical protein Tco_0216709 [Tanacetum coccineum]
MINQQTALSKSFAKQDLQIVSKPCPQLRESSDKTITKNPKVVERETEETTDKEQSNFQGSTAQIPPPVNPIPIAKPDFPKSLPKPNIPYPSRDIPYLDQLLNEDPSPSPTPKKNEDLKEVTKEKPSIEEPPELELKDLPSHLEYAYLEENDKLPIIIAKSLKDNEKEALLKVLKSHKRAIAWKITDIKGIDPRFCTHKILMEDDYKTHFPKSKTG